VKYNPAKYKELSEELTTWWSMQTQFKTKKALAAFLEVHPDTVGEYFSGRKFPRSDIANRLGGLTNIRCLKQDFNANLSSEVATQSETLVRQRTKDLPHKGGRCGERSVVISLERASCPFCGQSIIRFRRCAYCGQDFVWANVPFKSEKSK
jgi:hypothetical protein